MSKEQALAELAEAHKAAVRAEEAAALAQDRKRAAAQAAFAAGARGPEVAEVLGSTVQWAYQLKAKPPLAAA